MTTYAGVDGRVDQFVSRVGDTVQPAPVTRAAGILIPEGAGENRLFAGFNQIEAQVLEVGMMTEATCIRKPMTIIPLVVTKVQSVIAAGQITGSNLLTEMQKIGPPGTVLAFLEPLYDGGLNDVPPGSGCIANVYSNHHEELESKDLGSLKKIYLHIVDTVALVQALVLCMQAIVFQRSGPRFAQRKRVRIKKLEPPFRFNRNGKDSSSSRAATRLRRRTGPKATSRK